MRTKLQLAGVKRISDPITLRLGDSEAIVGQSDARLWLKKLPAASVDLIVTSPPYFVGKEYDTSCSIDDFGKEVRRVLPTMLTCLKPGGNLCWQIGNHVTDNNLTPLDAILYNVLSRHKALTLRNRIIWTFGHGTHSQARFSGRHETILWYTKQGRHHFDLDAVRVPQLYPGKRHYKGPNKGLWSGNPLGKNPGDVWDIGDVWGIPNVKSRHIEKTEHPCQFPTALVRRLIVALCPATGLVVDPYLGSGTTAVAALLESRNFSGCDLEPKYVAIATDRLKKLSSGQPIVREDTPARTPKEGEAVSSLPPHFTRRLDVLDA